VIEVIVNPLLCVVPRARAAAAVAVFVSFCPLLGALDLAMAPTGGQPSILAFAYFASNLYVSYRERRRAGPRSGDPIPYLICFLSAAGSDGRA